MCLCFQVLDTEESTRDHNNDTITVVVHNQDSGLTFKLRWGPCKAAIACFSLKVFDM